MSEKSALRYNSGKPQLRYNLTFPGAMEGRAAVCEYGARKYAPFNYLRGAPLSQYSDCLLRHLTAWMNGEDLDPESGLPHTDHIAWNADALAHFFRRPNANTPDDRPCKILLEQEQADDAADAERAIEGVEPSLYRARARIKRIVEPNASAVRKDSGRN